MMLGGKVDRNRIDGLGPNSAGVMDEPATPRHPWSVPLSTTRRRR